MLILRCTHIVKRDKEHAQHEGDDQHEQTNTAGVLVFVVNIGTVVCVARLLDARVQLRCLVRYSRRESHVRSRAEGMVRTVRHGSAIDAFLKE